MKPSPLALPTRFGLLLVAVGCAVSCAHPEGEPNHPGVKSTGAAVATSSDDDFKDASPKGARVFSEGPGAEPVALLRGRRVILPSSRVAFQIPQAWLDRYDSPPRYPVENLREMVTDPADLDRYYSSKDNLHFTRQQLDRVKSGEGNEWDDMFAKVVNDLLPFEKCIFHGGGEGWGEKGHSFGDLQMRVYLGGWKPAEIQKLVAERGLPAVRDLSRHASSQLSSRKAHLKGFADLTGGTTAGASLDRSTADGWQVESLTFPMTFYDYGATAVIDFYIKPFDETTAILVFMRTTFKGSQEAEMQEVIKSFRMSPRP